MTNEDHHRKSQQDAIQRPTECAEPSPNGYIYITATGGGLKF